MKDFLEVENALEEAVKDLKQEFELFISEVCEKDGEFPLLTYLDNGTVLDLEDMAHRAVKIFSENQEVLFCLCQREEFKLWLKKEIRKVEHLKDDICCNDRYLTLEEVLEQVKN